MEGYKDEENINKAEKVRKLVVEANKEKEVSKALNLLDESSEISLTLIQYLKDTYRNNFNVKYFPLYPGELDDDVTLDEIITSSSVSREISKFKKEGKIHDIGIVFEEEEYTYNVKATMFIGDDGELYAEDVNFAYLNVLLMPKEFYSFLQRIGIIVSAASLLYQSGWRLGIPKKI